MWEQAARGSEEENDEEAGCRFNQCWSFALVLVDINA